MKPMTYRGYAARIEYSDEDRCFVGHITSIQDIVGFHGDSVRELRSSFRTAVDHYLEVSERTGHPAQKPYSGKMMLRISPELHAKAAIRAEAAGKSLNQWTAEAIEHEL